MRLKSIGLENFRVFDEYQDIDLSDITIITGPNSSGKSSLFKALLLLQNNWRKNNLTSLSFKGDFHNLGSYDYAATNPKEPMVFTLAYEINEISEFLKNKEASHYLNLKYKFHKEDTPIEGILNYVEVSYGDTRLIKITQEDGDDWTIVINIVWFINNINFFSKEGKGFSINDLNEVLPLEEEIVWDSYTNFNKRVDADYNKRVEKLDKEINRKKDWIPLNAQEEDWKIYELLDEIEYELEHDEQLIKLSEQIHSINADIQAIENDRDSLENSPRHWKETIKNLDKPRKDLNDILAKIEKEPKEILPYLKYESEKIETSIKDAEISLERALKIDFSKFDSDILEKQQEIENIENEIRYYEDRIRNDYSEKIALCEEKKESAIRKYEDDLENDFTAKFHEIREECEALFLKYYENDLKDSFTAKSDEIREEDEKDEDEELFSSEIELTDKEDIIFCHKKFIFDEFSKELEEMYQFQIVDAFNRFKKIRTDSKEMHELELKTIFDVLKGKYTFSSLHLEIKESLREIGLVDNINSLDVKKLIIKTTDKYKIDNKIIEGKNAKDIFTRTDIAEVISARIIQVIVFIFQIMSQKHLNFSYFPAFRTSQRRKYGQKEEDKYENSIASLVAKYEKLIKPTNTKSSKANQQKKERKREKIDFIEKWIREFGIGMEIDPANDNENQFGIIIKGEKGKTKKLADLGFGVAQLLPIIMKVGLSIGEDTLLFIEEPEVHLHPKLQSRLADFFTDAVKQRVSLFVETHSEYLIRKLQYKVADKSLKPEQIMLLNMSEDETQSGFKKLNRNILQADGSINQEIQSLWKDFFDEALIQREALFWKKFNYESTSEKVFLSHSSADKPFVRKFKEDLEKEGITCWLDEEEMISGLPVQVLAEAVVECLCMIVFLSANYLSSDRTKGWLALEYEIAFQENKRVIPIIIDDLPDNKVPPKLFQIRKKIDNTKRKTIVKQLVEEIQDLQIQENESKNAENFSKS